MFFAVSVVSVNSHYNLCHVDEYLSSPDFISACCISNGFAHVSNMIAFCHHFYLECLKELNVDSNPLQLLAS